MGTLHEQALCDAEWFYSQKDVMNVKGEMQHTQGVYAEPIERRVNGQDNCAGHHLGTHNSLGLQVVVGSDESCICPDAWQ